MTIHHCTGTETEILRVARAAFPHYSGRKVELATEETLNVQDGSYWDGGSRTQRVFVHLDTLKTAAVPSMHPVFDRQQTPPGADRVTLPLNVACVEHDIFCGRDMGLRVIVRPDQVTALLPASASAITPDQERVLVATSSLKNTYGGETDIRFKRSGLTREQWDAAFLACQQQGLLNRQGAITATGRNAILQTKVRIN